MLNWHFRSSVTGGFTCEKERLHCVNFVSATEVFIPNARQTVFCDGVCQWGRTVFPLVSRAGLFWRAYPILWRRDHLCAGLPAWKQHCVQRSEGEWLDADFGFWTCMTNVWLETTTEMWFRNVSVWSSVSKTPESRFGMLELFFSLSLCLSPPVSVCPCLCLSLWFSPLLVSPPVSLSLSLSLSLTLFPTPTHTLFVCVLHLESWLHYKDGYIKLVLGCMRAPLCWMCIHVQGLNSVSVDM